ncbi:MAG TPA: choice-of-anchor L domain-containing protein [Bacteroidales bacterium]|nr:choice-of-anchor L domain-containing protein [Bacteroidales bacterium]
MHGFFVLLPFFLAFIYGKVLYFYCIFRTLRFYQQTLFNNYKSFCQLSINTAPTPAQLVQNVLIGGGVMVSNISYSGGAGSRAQFTNGSTTNLGLNNGIILCTGTVTQIANPATYFMSTNLGLAGDADLTAINTCTTFDPCILEFDFIPLSDTIRFRYVFGSEEYPNYVCSQYQDIFAFFISGPNPAGGNYNKYNMALIPGTALPVSVNSVNNGTPGGSYNSSGCTSLSYSNYYVDNAALGGTTIAFGGFTTPLTAWCKVVPCQTYHIKLAVADGYNGLYDSGVFLEANSFSSNVCNVSSSYSNTTFGNNAVEGCSQGYFSFVLTSPATSPYTVNYTLTGTAVNGTDYTSGLSVTIPVGQDSIAIPINPIFDGTNEGTETVIINYTSGCVPQTDTIYIMDNSLLQVNLNNDTTICRGATIPLSATVSGGITPYSYTWNTNPTMSSINVSPTSTTTYSVTITDYCSQTASANVTVTVNHVSLSTTTIDENCNKVNGSATVSITGSSCSTNYTYLWNTLPVQTTSTASNISAGTYTVTVSCGSCTSSASVVINNIPGPNISVDSVTLANCQASDGDATTIVTGGSSPYSYIWNSNPVQTTPDLINVIAGSYTVTVTDANGCTATTSVIVGQLNGPQITASLVNDANCIASDGNATTTVSGGSEPYSYSWNSTPVQTTSDLINVPTGNYTVTVTDSTGCVATANVTIGQINNLSVTATLVNDANCTASNGAATTTVSGGTATYSYSWNSTPVQTTTNLQNVPTGNYSVTVTDINGCTASASVTIGQINDLSVSASLVNNATCNASDGSATTTITGGNAPYSYSWNSSPIQTTADLQNVPTGNYSVTVTDINGCTAISTVTIGQVNNLSVSASVNDASCGTSDGMAITTVSNGTAPYSYSWNSSPVQTTDSLQNVASGNYSVIVSDANGCTASTSVTIGELSGPEVIVTSQNDLCRQGNGTATAFATGGNGAYSYSWSTNPQQTTETATNLAAGVYTVIVFSGMCSDTATVTVNSTLGPEANLNINPHITTIIDNPVSFYGSAVGDIMNWEWIFGDGNFDVGQNVQYQYSDTGTYEVMLVVVDVNGCTDTVTDIVHVNDYYAIYIPNAFTPNGDGKNDYFLPQGTYVDTTDYHMLIFNRWGNIVFETEKWGEGWNGTENNNGSTSDIIQGVYVYKINAVAIKGRKHEYMGMIVLIK